MRPRDVGRRAGVAAPNGRALIRRSDGRIEANEGGVRR